MSQQMSVRIPIYPSGFLEFRLADDHVEVELTDEHGGHAVDIMSRREAREAFHGLKAVLAAIAEETA